MLGAPEVLQSGVGVPAGVAYLPSTPPTCLWGLLPNAADSAVISVEPGELIVIDTVSHEGILEDQGRDPLAYFARYGVAPEHVMDDAIEIAASALHREKLAYLGPHVITGPIEVRGAEVGDIVVIEVVDLAMRAPYGIVSSRHGRGSLPGEMPEGGTLIESRFCHTEELEGDFARRIGRMSVPGKLRADGSPASFRFPLNPFLGTVGTSTAGERLGSVPPGPHGGNLDVALLGVGSRLHLPVLVPGAGVYVGDPHFAQGNGEVALTAFEAPLRATLRFSIRRASELSEGDAQLVPLGETDDLWIPIGLDLDLREAVKHCVRNAITLLVTTYGVDRASALAYLSASVDFSVSQVVDIVHGVHAAIRKADLVDLS